MHVEFVFKPSVKLLKPNTMKNLLIRKMEIILRSTCTKEKWLEFPNWKKKICFFCGVFFFSISTHLNIFSNSLLWLRCLMQCWIVLWVWISCTYLTINYSFQPFTIKYDIMHFWNDLYHAIMSRQFASILVSEVYYHKWCWILSNDIFYIY